MRSILGLAALAALCFVSSARAQVLYSAGVGADTGAGTATTTAYGANFGGDPTLNQGMGDDYTTTAGPTGTVTINEVQFNGGVSVANGDFAMNFYDAAGSFTGVSLLAGLPTTDQFTWTVTFAPLVIPSSGYLVFAPVPDGAINGVPGSEMSIGQASGVDVGFNDPAITASTDSIGTVSPATYFTDGAQTMSFELANVPEPASLGLILLAIPFRRRRR